VNDHHQYAVICPDPQQEIVDIHHFSWFRLVMAGLKSFLSLLAPLVSVSALALYERQRALVNLGVIKSAGGRGPGSGVPLTGENVAAILISLLASESLSEVDQRVVDLCRARPEIPNEEWIKLGKPTFLTEAGGLLHGREVLYRPKGSGAGVRTRTEWEALKFRVSRCWRGEIIFTPRRPIEYWPSGNRNMAPKNSIEVSAETPEGMIWKLIHLPRTTEDAE
jgi:hypothetical protein